MRHNKLIWAAAALVILAGCQKTDWTGKSIRFGAVSRPAPDTKTAYSGVFTGDVERINWTAGDKVRVYSDVATRKEGSDTYKWADYIVADPAAASDPTRSNANLSIGSGEGLQWGSGPHHFYGIYPAPASADAPAAVKGTSDNPMEATIPASGQTLANSGFMVAYKETAEPSGSDKVELLFEPAFTAFEVVANWKDTDMAIKSVTLKSGNTALTGAFTAYYNTTKWVFGGFPTYDSDPSSGNGTITVTPSSPIPLTSSSGPATFLFYALPQDLTQITLIFTVRISGASADVNRSLELKAATDIPAPGYNGRTYSAGQWLIFNACNKSKISGVLIPGSVWDVDNTTPVVLRETAAKDWDDNAQNMNYGTDLVVNAAGLDEVNLTTHSYKFSIYEPHDQTWKIKVLDGSGNLVPGVTIHRDSAIPSGSSDPASGSGELTGTIRGGDSAAPALVEFHLSGSTGGQNCTLSFSIIIDAGTANEHEYSINSEVVRGSWGTGTWDYKFINF